MLLCLNENLKKEYDKACIFFQKQLGNNGKAEKARAYLEGRGISQDLVEIFSIGWCPPDAKIWSKFEQLRGMLIFPIRDFTGKILAFSGRLPVSKEEVKDGEKRWWNESYNKSFFFYGLDVAIKHILDHDFAIIVEGQTDVISCHKFGLKNTIGLMSKDLSKKHWMVKLPRFTLNYILMLDGDSAGRKAAIKTKREIIDRKLPGDEEGISYRVADINLNVKGKEYDPDELLKKYGPRPIIESIKRQGVFQK
jgi:DNA primase